MHTKKFLKKNRCFIILGLVLIIVGTICFLTFPGIFARIIDGELVLSRDKHTYEVWKKTPIPLTLEFYFFNWTNPEEIRNISVKPNLEQVGPYKFTETKEKVDVVWNDNGTVSFRQLRWWYFNASRSNGSLDDLITTLNPVAVTVSAQSNNLNYFLQRGMSVSLKAFGQDVHITRKVGQFLFDGYDDTLISLAQNFPKIDGVEIPPFDKFGWFYKRNGSSDFDGLITMGTGTGGVPLGRIDRWNYKQRTGFYEGECGKISGSAGEFWPPNVSKEDISLFSPDMCREVGFQFKEEVVIHGITGYKFVGGEKTMDNGTIYSENSCYCGGQCVPSGVLNVSSCRYGSPGFISFPHFYLADPYYINQFDGLSPKKDEHEFYIILEPRTGIPLAVSARLQINLLMKPNEKIGLFNDVPKVFFPMIWFQQQVLIPEDMAGNLRQLLNLPFAADIVSSVVVVIGVLILASLIGILVYRKMRASVIAKQLQSTTFITDVTMPLQPDEFSRNKEIIVIKSVT